MSDEKVKDVFTQMAEKWPSAIVTREQIERFTGGLVKGCILRNAKYVGGTEPESVCIGRTIGYPVLPLVEWLRERAARKKEKKLNAQMKRRGRNSESSRV